MKSSQQSKPSFGCTLQYDRFAPVQKLVHHSDPQAICYFPPQRTENDECLYEFQLFEPKQIMEKQQAAGKKNIELTLALTAQNDDMARKIREIRDLINSEQLKANIFKKKYDDNEKIITELRGTKERLSNETGKIKTLNQSAIPNKSVELNTTNNTNAWLNQLLNKSELENLWSKQKNKESKITQGKVKSYTIDLSTFMNSARLNNQKASEKSKINESKGFEERLKSKVTNKLLTTRPLSSKPNLKVQLSEKQKMLNKNLSQLRNIKKTKCNPQL